MLSRQRSTGHKNPARPFARGEPQTERITVRMPKDNNRRASFHVRPCPSLTCSHEDCLLRCPLMMTAHQLTILGQARVPCTCFCLCIVVAHTQTKKTMVSCKCLHPRRELVLLRQVVHGHRGYNYSAKRNSNDNFHAAEEGRNETMSEYAKSKR